MSAVRKNGVKNMCIIVHNSEGKPLDKNLLRVAYDNNPHGVGVMWQENNTVHTIKALCKFEDVWELTKHLHGFCYTLHFRWRTVGRIQEEQCHPHRILNKESHGMDMYMMHNGTIFNLKVKDDQSDSQVFARKLQSSYEYKFQNIRTLVNHMHGMIPTVGDFNKFVLMNENSVEIINETAGTWRDRIWYSNVYSFEPGYREKKRTQKKLRKSNKQYLIQRDENNISYKRERPIELYSQPTKEIIVV
jgi:predicted glutamine amidotransferase